MVCRMVSGNSSIQGSNRKGVVWFAVVLSLALNTWLLWFRLGWMPPSSPNDFSSASSSSTTVTTTTSMISPTEVPKLVNGLEAFGPTKMTSSSKPSISERARPHRHSDFVRPSVIYGHVHIHKTGGTNLNGRMAVLYERVCGNAGYSYDAFQFHHRAFQFAQHNTKPRKNKNKKSGDGVPVVTNNTYDDNDDKEEQEHYRHASPQVGGVDLVKVQVPQSNRGRLPFDLNMMDEIGYEDCDFISLEMYWAKWGFLLPPSFTNKQHNMELHVPCREAVDHLMSSCNHRGRQQFDCSAGNIRSEVEKCVIWELNKRFTPSLLNFVGKQGSIWSPLMDFSSSLEQQQSNFTLNRKTKRKVARRRDGIFSISTNISDVKCFSVLPNMDKYLDHMGQLLQSRRMKPRYFYRVTNSKRDKSKECIWEHPELVEQVRTILIREGPAWYQFCDECIGSDKDLLRGD